MSNMHNYQTNRPIYERPMDLANERSLAQIASANWRCSMSKLKAKSSFDYAALRDQKVAAFVEMKVRTNPANKYSSYMISITKIIKAQQVFQALDIPVFLLVKWTDSIGFTALHKVNATVQIGGRKDRKDPQDIEPVALIPIDQFVMLKESQAA